MNWEISNSSLSTKIDLSQKHINKYKLTWDLEWIKELPKFYDYKIELAIEEENRMKLFNWLMEVSIAYRLKKHAYFKTLMILDLFLQELGRPLQINEIQLWGLTALFIAVKYEEEDYKFDLKKLVEFSKNSYSTTDFIKAEEIMFRKLGFNVSFATFLDVLEELMMRNNIFFERFDKFRNVAETILVRCLLSTEMLKVRADLFCSSVLLYTVSLFYEHFIYYLESKGKNVNRSELNYKETVFLDSIAKVTRLNKEMMTSVKERIREVLENFESLNFEGALNHIANLCDLDAF